MNRQKCYAYKGSGAGERMVTAGRRNTEWRRNGSGRMGGRAKQPVAGGNLPVNAKA